VKKTAAKKAAPPAGQRRRAGAKARERLGPLAFLGILLVGAAVATPSGYGLVRYSQNIQLAAGLDGAQAKMLVTSCTGERNGRGDTSYTCHGLLTPANAAPHTANGVVTLASQGRDQHGKTMEVGCTPTGSCVPADLHAVLSDLLLVLISVGFLASGVAVAAFAFFGLGKRGLDEYAKVFGHPMVMGLKGLGAVVMVLLAAVLLT
jgi:hypothetical protein